MAGRVSKQPINIPNGVEIIIGEKDLTVKGPKGQLTTKAAKEAPVTISEQVAYVAEADNSQYGRSIAGTIRALLANMVKGVSAGFERRLTLIGVGYRAQMQGTALNLTVGFSHPVLIEPPVGITFETPSLTEILVKGISKHLVGQIAAKIREIRPPEPYKGKGIRYSDETVEIKETKK
jgi:large subunit ribosomal protein L6